MIMTARLCLVFIHFCMRVSDLEHLPEEHRQTLQCVKRIAIQYFDPTFSIAISDPRKTHKSNATRRFTNISMDYDVWVSDIIIKELTYGMLWPVLNWYANNDDLCNITNIRKKTREKPLQFYSLRLPGWRIQPDRRIDSCVVSIMGGLPGDVSEDPLT